MTARHCGRHHRANVITGIDAMKCVLALTCTLMMPPSGLPSNVAPLALGMTPGEASVALAAPLAYVSGHRGSDIYVGVTSAGVPGLFPVDQTIHLQFRNGCLTGGKTHWRMRGGAL